MRIGKMLPVSTCRTLLSDLEIGHAAHLLPIEEVAASAGIAAEHLEPYGRYIAKVAPTAQAALSDRPHPRSTSSSPR